MHLKITATPELFKRYGATFALQAPGGAIPFSRDKPEGECELEDEAAEALAAQLELDGYGVVMLPSVELEG